MKKYGKSSITSNTVLLKLTLSKTTNAKRLGFPITRTVLSLLLKSVIISKTLLIDEELTRSNKKPSGSIGIHLSLIISSASGLSKLSASTEKNLVFKSPIFGNLDGVGSTHNMDLKPHLSAALTKKWGRCATLDQGTGDKYTSCMIKRLLSYNDVESISPIFFHILPYSFPSKLVLLSLSFYQKMLTNDDE
ncbi:hypothetical protein D3C79_502750 [compost metagenome]